MISMVFKSALAKGIPVAEFLSSPYSLVIIGLVVLALAIVLLMIWIVIIDRRTRGVADDLETERRKVAEMQKIVVQRGAPRQAPVPQRSAPVQAVQAQAMPVRSAQERPDRSLCRARRIRDSR